MLEHANNSLYYMKKKPIQRRSMVTVESILKAGAQLLLEIGYDKSSTNKIADRAGVSVGSLYEYFPGKEAIFAELRRRERERHYRSVLDQPPAEGFRAMLRMQMLAYVNLLKSNLLLHAALIREVPQFEMVEDEELFFADYLPRISEFMKQHKNELGPKRDPLVAAELATRVMRSTIDNYVLHAPEKLEGSVVIDELSEMLEGYLAGCIDSA